jgi:hypothetical protein
MLAVLLLGQFMCIIDASEPKNTDRACQLRHTPNMTTC